MCLAGSMRESDSSPVGHQWQAPLLQFSKTTNKPKYMFPIVRKPVHYPKHNPPLAELPSFALGLDLLTSCILNTRCPFCLFIHKPAPGRQASCFLTPSCTSFALFAFSATQLWFMYGLHQGNSFISIGIEGVCSKTRALGCNMQWLLYALNRH